MGGQVVKIGLFSRALYGGWHKATLFAELVRLVEDNSDLDLILCAGFTIPDLAYFGRFCSRFQNRQTLIVCEVGEPPKLQKKGHGIFVVGGGQVRQLPPQVGATAADFASIQTTSHLLHALGNRQIKLKGVDALLVSCGEINVLKGSRFRHDHNSVSFAHFNSVFNNADVVLNPTHDRMIRAWVADKKGQAISSGALAMDQRPRLYCRVANWNVRGGQLRNLPSLHKAFSQGAAVPLSNVPSHQGVLFSRFAVSFTPPRALKLSDLTAVRST